VPDAPFAQRFIAFVDILGFREIVDRMTRETHLFEIIRDVLKELDQKSLEVQQYRREKVDRKKTARSRDRVSLRGDTDLQMTAFSDCYVLSEVSTPWRVLAAVQSLGSRLLAEGILTRGGIVQGDAYHRDRVLFGPGIIEAYKLESDVAKYPRILVEDRVRRAVWKYHEDRWKGRLLKRDVDGCWFVNLLVPSFSSWSLVADGIADQDSKAYLKNLRGTLSRLWDGAKDDASHMSKVWWLIHKFNIEAEKEGVYRIKRAHNDQLK
jgi:hypothetical protein